MCPFRGLRFVSMAGKLNTLLQSSLSFGDDADRCVDEGRRMMMVETYLGRWGIRTYGLLGRYPLPI